MEELKVFYRAFREYKEKLGNDEAHRQIIRALQGNADDAFSSSLSHCELDEEWIETIEANLPYVERALDEQRRFIQSHEEIRRIDQARKTGVESIRHLAQHSNMISHIESGDVVPDRILIVERDDNYAIYENRFLYTLVMRLQAFLDERYKAVVDLNGATVFSYTAHRDTGWNRRHLKADISISYRQRAAKPEPTEAGREKSCLDRIELLRRQVNRLTSAPLMAMLKGVAQVSSPIVRTNVFKKNDHFKRSLELFEYLENYHKPGYEVITAAPESANTDSELHENLCEVIALETFIGQLASNETLLNALEANYLHENELAEQERIRLEEERERQVQARIQAARDEEIEIRRIEVAKREAIIAEKNACIEALESELNDTRSQLMQKTAENDALKDELRQKGEEINALQLTLEALRSEYAELQRLYEERGLQMEEAVQRHASELSDLIRQHENALAEQRTSLEKQNRRALDALEADARKHLAEREADWQQQMAVQKNELSMQHERTLAAQKHRSDLREEELQNEIKQKSRRENELLARIDRSQKQAREAEILKRQMSQMKKDLKQLETLKRRNETLRLQLSEQENINPVSPLRRLFKKSSVHPNDSQIDRP